jgi:hypothetical protein
MTRNDHKIIFMALGFLAVIIRDVPRDKQALRATAIAKLIENFCMDAVADDLTVEPAANTDSPSGLAHLFASLVNDNNDNKNLVKEAMAALENCLAADGAAFSEATLAKTVSAGQPVA